MCRLGSYGWLDEMKKIKCGFCGKSYKSEEGLTQHHMAVHSTGAASVKKSIECPLCKKVFSSRQGFVRHYLHVHGHPTAEQLPVQLAAALPQQAAPAQPTRLPQSQNHSVAGGSGAMPLPVQVVRPVRNGPPRYNKPPDYRPPKPIGQPAPAVHLVFNGEPKVTWQPLSYAQNLLNDFDEQLGRKTHIAQVSRPSLKEVILGVDFGTSCTKVVLGDSGLQTAYAVPFTQMAGVSAYLLPTHLGEKDGVYSLKAEGVVHNDLKLAMLGNPSDAVSCARVAAYLALVIRAARAWIFASLTEQYLASDLLWSLALGQPADQATSSRSQALFKKLGEVAWFLAGQEEPLTPGFCLEAWRSFDEDQLDPDDIEVLVMPELAAQIHGFVSSTAFDPLHPNIYLLVDVGAGTVDASVFKVRKTKIQGTNQFTDSTSFDFFTNAVEAYGSMNLHRHRIGWWQDQLRSRGKYHATVAALDEIRLPTEYRGHLPKTFDDYIEGVTVTLQGGAMSPDQHFLQRVRNQVAGEVLFGAKKHNLLDKESIAGMPFFLCGGGARHDFYKQLITEMKEQRGCSWLNALHRELTLPNNLRAEGVTRMDYDRLSVAYGLSQLRLDSVKQAVAMKSRVSTAHASDWGAHYVDKDMC